MTVGFLGAGNMGGALATAVAKAIGGDKVLLSDKDTAKAQTLATKIGAGVVNAAEMLYYSDYVFLGVKPQMMATALAPLQAHFRPEQVLITMAAGLTADRVAAMAGGKCPVIRIMPNTPVAVGEGMILYAVGDGVTDVQERDFTAMLSGAGRLCRMPESMIDAGSAVSGCGPAFVYLFIEALADGGVECGLPRDKALDLAAQTVAGAAKMVLGTGTHPGVLKDAVCSPGGTTIAGVHALEAGGLRNAAMDAVTAAYDRTLELAGK